MLVLSNSASHGTATALRTLTDSTMDAFGRLSNTVIDTARCAAHHSRWDTRPRRHGGTESGISVGGTLKIEYVPEGWLMSIVFRRIVGKMLTNRGPLIRI